MKTSALLASMLAALALSACGGDSGSTNSASATGGNAATSGSVCDEYEKAFAASIANVDAATKEAMQKAFDQSKEALQNLPADQKEAACKVSLDALNGKAPTDAATSAEDAKEAASEAAEEAKEAAADAKEAASEAAEEAKEAAAEAKEAASK